MTLRKTLCGLLCVLGSALAGRGDTITFSERYADQLQCVTEFGETFCTVDTTRSLTLNARVRVPGLGQVVFTEADSLLVALGGLEVRLLFGAAEPGWTQNQAVFLELAEGVDGSPGRVVRRLTVSRSGDMATMALTHSALPESVVAEDHVDEAGRFVNDWEGARFRFQAGPLPEVSRRVYYSGLTTLTTRTGPGEFPEVYTLATVTVSGAADVTAPRALLVSPAANSVYTGLEPEIEVDIQATDNVAVQDVWVSFNGSGFETIALGFNDLWGQTLRLVPGINTLRVYAEDYDGNFSATNTYRFRHVLKLPLTLEVADPLAGRVIGATNQQLWEVGQPCRLTAQPRPNHFFREWEIESDHRPPTVLTNPVLTFVMETGQVVRARFVTNVFLGIAGTSHGLFSPRTGDVAAVSVETSGALRLALTAQRRFSGQLQLAGATYPFTGGADLEGRSRVDLAPRNQPGITLLLQFDVDDDGVNTGVTGTVSRSGWQAVLRSVPAATGTQLKTNAGKYTLVIPGHGGTSTATGPAGSGAATATLSPSGVLTVAGALGDGTLLNGPWAASAAGELPVFRSLYGGKGLLWGWARLAIQPPQLACRELAWIRPPGVPGAPLHPDGFTVGRELVGGIYAASTRGTNALGWSTAEGLVVLEEGNLTLALSNRVHLVGQRLTVLDGNPNRLTLTLSPGNGGVTGTFLHPATLRPTAIKGVLLPWTEGGGRGEGWFAGTNQSGRFVLRPVPSPQ